MITTQKISISLPSYLYDYLATTVSGREISSYVTDAVEHKILNEKINNPITDFIALREQLPKFSSQEILSAIHQGRT